MAQVSFTINDADLTRVLDAFAKEFGWESDSGVTKGEFARQKVVEYVKKVVREREAADAAQAAYAQAVGDSPNVT